MNSQELEIEDLLVETGLAVLEIAVEEEQLVVRIRMKMNFHLQEQVQGHFQ